MNGNDVIKLGYPVGPLVGQALRVYKFFKEAYEADDVVEYLDNDVTDILVSVKNEPARFVSSQIDSGISELARMWIKHYKDLEVPLEEVLLPVEYATPVKVFDSKVVIEEGAREQALMAARIPITRAVAVMSDGHQGYGLPIGGVWATHNAVSPNAVGSDIACQVNATVFHDHYSRYNWEFLEDILWRFTKFKYECFDRDASGHPVFQSPVWDEVDFLKNNPLIKETAIKQFASSGDGNHFANIGYYNREDNPDALFNRRTPEARLSLVTHWGSRSLGAAIARHFDKLAVKERKHLPKEAQGLAWLYADSDLGEQYIMAMQLAEWYASAGHAYVHDRIGAILDTSIYKRVSSVHNIATFERLEDDKSSVWVHRKGATPAHRELEGVIASSMVDDVLIVEGEGLYESIYSAPHGAGRRMSRGEAKRTLSPENMTYMLLEKDIKLLGAGLDESPEAYKDINDVMNSMEESVTVTGRITPKIVRMAP